MVHPEKIHTLLVKILDIPDHHLGENRFELMEIVFADWGSMTAAVSADVQGNKL